MPIGRILHRHQMLPDLALVPERGGGLACIGQQCLAERRISPGAGNDASADMRTYLGFISFNDCIQSRGIGVALLDQDSLKGTDPQFGFRELGGLVMVVPVVVVMRSHGRSPVWRQGVGSGGHRLMTTIIPVMPDHDSPRPRRKAAG